MADAAEEHGLEIAAGGTMIIQNASDVNAGTESSALDGSYSVDIEISKSFDEVGGKAFMLIETGDGAGVTTEITAYSNVNDDADASDNTLAVTEIWYEQSLWNDKVAVTFGKIDATAYIDGNEVANDETSQFLGSMFVNSPVVEFPDNGFGVSAQYQATEWMAVDYLFMDAQGDYEDLDDGVFQAIQLSFATNFKRPGNYRFYTWINSQSHTSWDTGDTFEDNYGFGISIDQQLSDHVMGFLRFGWQDPSVYLADDGYSLESSWSAGVQVNGGL